MGHFALWYGQVLCLTNLKTDSPACGDSLQSGLNSFSLNSGKGNSELAALPSHSPTLAWLSPLRQSLQPRLAVMHFATHGLGI